MLGTMKIGDIYTGAIDAKDELISKSEGAEERFLDTYVFPDSLNIDAFLKDDYCFITGLKGTGKTALLRYICLCAQEELNSINSFILFKTDYNTYDKENMIRLIDKNYVTQIEDYSHADYEIIWSWILHREVAKNISRNHNRNGFLFDPNEAWEDYEKYVSDPFPAKTSTVREVVKNARGEMNISLLDGGIGLKLGIEFDLSKIDENKFRLNKAVTEANELLKKIPPLQRTLFIFVDELEISYESKEKYNRDIVLIRDLIAAIDRMNRLFREQKQNIKIICSVRSEVITAVASTGKEINKALTSFGIPIIWNAKNSNHKRHRLLDILIGRIRHSEKMMGLKTNENDDEIWQAWVGDKLGGQNSGDYILNRTWFRPRDIVRLMILAKNIAPEEEKFNANVFDSIKRKYSEDSWNEISEELNARYSHEQIGMIKTIFYGYYNTFTFAELKERVQFLKKEYSSSMDVCENIAELLNVLFRIGMIGNVDSGGKQRWASKDEAELLLFEPWSLTIHTALRVHLSCGPRKKIQKRLDNIEGPYDGVSTSCLDEVISITMNTENSSPDSEQFGTVKHVNYPKGFAYISLGDETAFARLRNFVNVRREHVRIGDSVAFKIISTQKRFPEAVEIRKITIGL